MSASSWEKEIKDKREAQLDREENLHKFEAKRLEEMKERPGRIIAAQVFEGTTLEAWAEKHPTSSAAKAIAEGALATEADPETGGFRSLVDPGEKLSVSVDEEGNVAEREGTQPEEVDPKHQLDTEPDLEPRNEDEVE